MSKGDFKYSIKRYDLSEDRSLKAWSAADEFLLTSFSELEKSPNEVAIYNDRFGFLACHLHQHSPLLITHQRSQERAIQKNLEANKLGDLSFQLPLGKMDVEMDLVLMKIPKSLDLFRLFLEHIVHQSKKEVNVICAFMTRHFTQKILDISMEYFEDVKQSKAIKKARVLHLSNKRANKKENLIHHILFNNSEYKQYYGVFSSNHIDYASQFLLKQLIVNKNDQCILDLASGNGVIASEIAKDHPDSEYHLLDDSYLAVESAKMNLHGRDVHHHYNNDLSSFKEHTFDLIVTNPPFHFEHEINIQIALALFKDCYRILKVGGNIQIVGNRHLNYGIHLKKSFPSVKVIGENNKFIVYQCFK